MKKEYGRIPEWPKGADCKSVVNDFDGSNPSSPTIMVVQKRCNRKKVRFYRAFFVVSPVIFSCKTVDVFCLFRQFWRFEPPKINFKPFPYYKI